MIMSPAIDQTELAIVKTKLSAIERTLEDIKTAVTDLNKLTTTVAVLGEQQRSQERELDEHSKQIEKLDRVASMNASYLNKIRGGLSLTVTIVTVVQAAVLAGAGWLLSTVIELKQDTHTLNRTVVQITEDQQNIARRILKEK
jgi:ABC-type multidrug transport system fused ATPase/permease subunit